VFHQPIGFFFVLLVADLAAYFAAQDSARVEGDTA
jgi:uncharacterized membrane protein